MGRYHVTSYSKINCAYSRDFVAMFANDGRGGGAGR